MKKYMKLLWLALVLVIGISSTEIPAEAKARYKLNKTSISLQKGTTYQLKSNYKGKKIKWTSKNKKVAVVNSKGKVTAKKNGNTYITCKAGKKTLKCKVRVFTARMSVSKKTIYVKNNYRLKVKGYRVSGWKSSNNKIATVSKSGVVTGKKAGVAKIYAYVGNSRLSCTITVKNKTSKPTTSTEKQPETTTEKKPETTTEKQPETTTEKKPDYTYSFHILNNYKIYVNSVSAHVILYIKTNNPDPDRILVGTSDLAGRFADVKYTGDPAILTPVPGGYLTCQQAFKTGQQTLTVYEMYKGADKTWYYYDMPEKIGCKAGEVSFYAYDSQEGYEQFVSEILAEAKKSIVSEPIYTTGEYSKLPENEKILRAACNYVMFHCTYPCNNAGYADNWGYVETLKKYGAWWDTREVDSMSGPSLLCDIAKRLGAEKATQRSGEDHAYVDVIINGHEYKGLCMTPFVGTGSINPDEIEYFDFSQFR